MKYIFIVLTAVFFLGCGDDTSSPPKSTYTLLYDQNHTSISGVVTLNVGTIPKNHIIILKNFLPVVEGCKINLISSNITPNSLVFTAQDTKQSAFLDIGLLSPCYAQVLQLQADYVDSSVLDDINITHTTQRTYIFDIDTSTTFTD